MDYLLRFPIEDIDLDFLNTTTIKYDVLDVHRSPFGKLVTDLDEFDSGWRDMATGARLVDKRDRIVFRDVSPQELTLLLIKFPDRLKKLTESMERIYNIKQIEDI